MKKGLTDKIRSSVIFLPLILPLPNISNIKALLPIDGFYVKRYYGVVEMVSDTHCPIHMIDYDKDGRIDEKYGIFYTGFPMMPPLRIDSPITREDNKTFNKILSKLRE